MSPALAGGFYTTEPPWKPLILGQVYKAVSTIAGKWLMLIAEDKAVGWHHRLNGCESEQTLGDGEWQGSLVSCTPWGHKESDMTERLNDEEKKHEIGKGDNAETETGKEDEETTERITFKKLVYQNFQIKILIPNTTILFKTVITWSLKLKVKRTSLVSFRIIDGEEKSCNLKNIANFKN